MEVVHFEAPGKKKASPPGIVLMASGEGVAV